MSQASPPPDDMKPTADLGKGATPVPEDEAQRPTTANAAGPKMADPPQPVDDEAAGVETARGKPEVTIDDFLKLDLRVATVKSCEPHPNADKLLKLTLDDGTPEGRQICAGLRGIYEPDQLVGKQIVIVANLAPRKMRGEISQGMLLAASSEDRNQVVIVSPVNQIGAGASVG